MPPTPASRTRKRSRQPRTPRSVRDELRARAKAGRSLASGKNRGDWVYATAVRFFGSWSAAVEAAGFDYSSLREAGLSADEVLRRIRRAADAGQALRARDLTGVASAAYRHFGTWRAAVRAAGCELPSPYKWTPERVLSQLRDDLRRGRSLRTCDVLARNEPLYGAARRRFGSWKAAVEAASLDALPRRARAEVKRRRSRS